MDSVGPSRVATISDPSAAYVSTTRAKYFVERPNGNGTSAMTSAAAAAHVIRDGRATGDASATAAACRAASGARRSHHDATRPPRPIAASTAASMTLTASVVVRTYIERNRNQITSSARRAAPARNADARSHRGAGRAAAGAIATSAARSFARRDSHRPMPAADRLSSAAVHAAPVTPKRSTSTTSATTTPATAPSVFQPYKRPSTGPNASVRASTPASTGSVAPIAAAGTTSTANAATRRTRLSSHGASPARRVSGTSSTVSDGRSVLTAGPMTATTTSSVA